VEIHMSSNQQTRFGRSTPTLSSLIPVFGYREINRPIKNAIPPHSLKYHQIIYVDKGELEIWVDGLTWKLTEGDLIIIRPYEVMSYLQGSLPLGSHSFLQLDLCSLSETELRESAWNCLHHFNPRVALAGKKFADPFAILIDEHKRRDMWSAEVTENQVKQVLYNLIRLHKDKFIKHKVSPLLLESIDAYIESNLSNAISIKELAELAGYSDNHFRRLFTQLSGLQPLKYVNHRKIEVAKKRLIDGNETITDIAFGLGFSSTQYFASFFKKITSFTPLEFRTEARALIRRKPDSVSAAEAAAQLDTYFTGN